MNDFKFALRQLLKNPGFTAVAVLTLALGIGANSAMFTVINTLMLRSLPVRKPHELVQVSVAGVGGRNHTFTYPGYERLRDGAGLFSGLFAAGNVGEGSMVAFGMGGTETEIIRTQPVTGNLFRVIVLQPYVGDLLFVDVV